MNMGIHMKTTVEISEALLHAARERARHRGTTLRVLIEEGLRSVLDEPDAAQRFVLRDASVEGSGVCEGGSGVREEGSGAREGMPSEGSVLSRSYEGRGG